MSNLVLPVCDRIHEEASKILFPGAVAVDATMGNGLDTLFLCRKVGKEGKVYAFDIQETAVKETEALLKSAEEGSSARLILDGHENMAFYVKEKIQCALFNLGYLPKGDHRIVTRKETTLKALETATSLLAPGGAVFLALYWGHPGGEEEKSAVESFAEDLPSSLWSVSETSFPNKRKAPLMMVIQKKTR
ncbi:MAG: class I SAM-dependent methyltransferase [Clostridia bacterium]